MPLQSLRQQELRLRLGWFVKIRWVFALGFGAAAVVGYHVVGLRFPLGKVLAAQASILLYNAIFLLYQRRAARLRPRYEALLQMYLDLIHLTVLIHLLGGLESPFLSFYLFHAILGSLLLPHAQVVILGVVSSGLVLAVAGLEFFAVIPHHHFPGAFGPHAHQDPMTVLVMGSAFLVILFCTIYMSSTIVASLRRREEEVVAVREALATKSQDLEAANLELRRRQETLIRTEKLVSLGALSAGIAHEINNPIQFIQGNMQIVREAMQDITPILDDVHQRNGGLPVARLESPFFRQHIGVLINDMAEGACRIRDIVKDLKTFARRDEGRLDDDVDLNEVMRVSRRLLHNRLKHYQVEEALDAELPTIKGNGNRIEQVLVNVLLNASEAISERAGGVIRLGTRREPDERVRASIGDNGPGMTDEVKRRLFDPFFTTKSRAGGSGLGLAISYAIVQEHGGQIDFESELGKGTTFHILLPIERLVS
jgi:signal transduction histidine kinase